MHLRSAVIGSSVESAFYAFMTDSHFFTLRGDPPMFYRHLDLAVLNCRTEPELWSKLLVYLGLLGRFIAAPPPTSVRITDQEIRVSSSGHITKYTFEKCTVFTPDSLILQNPITSANERTYLVLDDLELSSLGPPKTSIQPRTADDDFCKLINFYSSDRVDGASFITDCVAESVLTHEQINDFDYSDTMVKFVVQRHLQEVGVQGSFMNFYKSGKPKFRKPRVKHVKRMVFERDNNKYENTGNIVFKSLSLKEIIDEFGPKR